MSAAPAPAAGPPTAAASSSSAAPAAPARTRSPSCSAATPRFADVPIEARFHCNKRGMPDLLEGRITLRSYLEKLRGFWWHRVRVDGQPARPLQPAAPERVRRRRRSASRPATPTIRDRRLPARCSSTCSGRSPSGGQAGPGRDVLAQRPGGADDMRLFPEAKIVHALRDGRDSASSVTGKTWGPARSAPGSAGGRIACARSRRGVRGSEDGAGLRDPADRFRVVLLDDLVGHHARGQLRRAARVPRGRGRSRHPRLLRSAHDPRARARRALAHGAPARSRVWVQRRYERTVSALEREQQPRRSQPPGRPRARGGPMTGDTARI